MSKVTSVVIICPSNSTHNWSKPRAEYINLVNNWLVENYDYATNGCKLFKDISDSENVAGTKHPQSYIYIGGFNFFPDAEFAQFFKSLEWKNATLLISNENWDNSPHLCVPKLKDEDYLSTSLGELDI